MRSYFLTLWISEDRSSLSMTAGERRPTLGAIPVSCLMCWLNLAVFLAMLWVLRRTILSLMVRFSVFLYLSAARQEALNKLQFTPTLAFVGVSIGWAGAGTESLTDFSEAFVLVDAAVQGDGGVSGLIQQGARRVRRVGVFLDGLQEERVPGDPLDRHHQEETQGGGVDLRAASTNRTRVT